jgi:hypothetical protein
MAAITKQNQELSQAEKEEALAENVFGIAEDLKLTQKHMAALIKTTESTYKKWKAAGRIPFKPQDPVYEAILNFLRLSYNLEAIFQSSADEKVWLESPHEVFKKSPLDYALESFENLIAVRQYSDYVRGHGA